MRRICSLLWNDIKRIQKIGNMKNRRISVSAAPRKIRPVRLTCSIVQLLSGSLVTVRALAQSQPVLDEDIRQDVGDDPQDHQQRRGPADIGVLEELQISLHLK